MARTDEIIEQLREVKDPEIPVLDIVEMGIVRDTKVDGTSVIVTITPTYSGCPAMDVIGNEIKSVLHGNGFEIVTVELSFAPPWTTEWITDEAKEKLRVYGIAPPVKKCGSGLQDLPTGTCPFCSSTDTELRSEFGSTACKALYFCNGCCQPFEYFKCI